MNCLIKEIVTVNLMGNPTFISTQMRLVHKLASYLYLYWWWGQIEIKRQMRWDDFNLPVLNFFIYQHSSSTCIRRLYISSKTIFHDDVYPLWIIFLLTSQLLTQRFMTDILKSSYRELYGRHYELVDRKATSVSEMAPSNGSRYVCTVRKPFEPPFRQMRPLLNFDHYPRSCLPSRGIRV